VLHLCHYWGWEINANAVDEVLKSFKMEWTYSWAKEGVLSIADAVDDAD
jgi:hypothetical protein